MNEAAQHSSVLHPLTDKERTGLRHVLLEMYDDLATLCRKEELCLMLAGGSCLGAVRHKGFIPWDDDLDLMMIRQDYERLIKLLNNDALNTDKYEFRVPNKKSDSPAHFLKIYRRGTLDAEIMTAESPFPKGIFLDVFPIDGAPKNKMFRRFYGTISFILRGLGTCVTYAKFSGKAFDEFAASNHSLEKAVKRKKLLGRILSIVPHRQWMYLFDKLVRRPCRSSGFATIPAGRNHYLGEMQISDIYLSVKDVEFEGRTAAVPEDSDCYLRGLYGDNYMQLPPENKRERHFVYRFALPE